MNTVMIHVIRFARVPIEVPNGRAVGLAPLALDLKIVAVQRNHTRAKSIESVPHLDVVLQIQRKRQVSTNCRTFSSSGADISDASMD